MQTVVNQVPQQLDTQVNMRSQMVTATRAGPLRETGIRVYDHWITDIHTYDFYIGLYNTDECRLDDRILTEIQGDQWYVKIMSFCPRVFYSLVGQFAINTKLSSYRIYQIRIALLLLFIILPTFVSLQVPALRYAALTIILIYIIVGFPAVFLRARAAWIYQQNDSIIPHKSQMSKMIFVERIEGNMTNQFYEQTIEQIHILEQNLNLKVTTEQLQLLAQQTNRLTGRTENTYKFMLMTHDFHQELHNVFTSISSIFSKRLWVFIIALGLQVFYLVLFIIHS